MLFQLPLRSLINMLLYLSDFILDICIVRTLIIRRPPLCRFINDSIYEWDRVRPIAIGNLRVALPRLASSKVDFILLYVNQIVSYGCDGTYTFVYPRYD
jgi:hypothetical protein